jgi:AcrR family transcriptional regulator
MAKDTHHKKPGKSTRELLLEAGINLLTSKGYSGAITREIAGKAGVTEHTLYRHFSSKDELLVQGIIDLTQRPLDFPVEPTGNLEQDLVRFAESITDSIRADIDHILSVLPELNRYPDLMTEGVQKNIQQFNDRFESLFRHYRQTGHLVQISIEQMTSAFVGPMLMTFIFSKVISTSREFDCELHVKHFLIGYRK